MNGTGERPQPRGFVLNHRGAWIALVIFLLLLVGAVTVAALVLELLSTLRGSGPYGPAGERGWLLLVELLVVLAIVTVTAFTVRYVQGNLKELARVEADLEMASRVQSKLLESPSSCGEGVDFASCYLPARQVGGDYLEFIPLGEGKWGIVVADVMGHGVSAALLMTMVRTAFRGMAGQDRRPRAVLETLNAALTPDLEKTGSMVCVSYATYDRGKHRLAFAQAGHHPPLHLDHATGEVRKLVSNVQPIGINETNTFKEEETALASGDVVVFFTDGLVECRNGDGTRFGVERVERIIRENPHLGAGELRQAIMEAVRRFTRNAPGDDLALAVIKVTQ